MSADDLPVSCPSCGGQSLDYVEPSNNSTAVVCGGCGTRIGTYGQIREARYAQARAEAEKLLGVLRKPARRN